MDGSSRGTTARLSRAYLAVVQWEERQRGLLGSLRARLIEFGFRWRPEFRGLDTTTRRAVYREIRDAHVGNPASVAVSAWTLALLAAGTLVGGIAGLVLEISWLAANVAPGERVDVVGLVKMVALVMSMLLIGLFAGALVARLAFARARAALPDWRLIVQRARRESPPAP